MSGSNFNLITQELLKQKQTMDQLEEENRELRHQLAELRVGRGIFVLVDGQRFALMSDNISDSTLNTHNSVDTDTQAPTVETMMDAPVVSEEEQEAEPVVADADITHEQTEEFAVNANDAEQPDTDAMPELAPTASLPVVTSVENPAVAGEQNTEPTFLEEAMINEFTAAATSPLAVWPDIKQEQKKSTEVEADEELAILRRQLIGSYLLE